MSTIYRTNTPNGFVAFRVVDGQMYWIDNGNDYQTLVAGGSPVQTVSEATIQDLARTNTYAGPAPTTGFLSGRTQGIIDRAAGAAPAPQPAGTIGSISGPATVNTPGTRVPGSTTTPTRPPGMPAYPAPVGGGPSGGGGGGNTGGGGGGAAGGGSSAPADPMAAIERERLEDERARAAQLRRDQMLETFGLIQSFLNDAGLGHLATIDGNGTPGGWLWGIIQQHGPNGALIQMAIEQHEDWRTRFAPIVRQRERAGRGEAVVVMSPKELMEYERDIQVLMRNAGLPPSMYNSFATAHRLVDANVSVTETQQRLGDAWNRVRNVDPLIRGAFEDFYGVGYGDTALAAFFLDPETTLAELDTTSRAAYTRGMGQRYGLDIRRDRAENIATSPRTEAGIDQGLRMVSEMQTIFERGITERGNLTAETTGVDSVFDGDARANRDMERRVARRRTADMSSAGGAMQDRDGLIGLRTAR